MRLLNYLNEAFEKPLELDAAEKIILKNCKQNFKKFLAEEFIFRGIENYNDDFLLFDGKKKRESANTSNHYTILFSEILDSWKNIPPRNKALICTTGNAKAERYGNIFYVIPYDKSVWAYCDKEDFWFITNNNDKLRRIDIYDLEEFNNYMFGGFRVSDSKAKIKSFVDLTLEDLYKKIYKRIDNLSQRRIFSRWLMLGYLAKNTKIKAEDFAIVSNEVFEKYLKECSSLKIIDILNKELSPSKLHIKTTSDISEIAKKNNIECWTSSPCVLVSEEEVKNNFSRWKSL